MVPELKTLIAVCKYGTFASAGEQIGLTQSAVSSQIKRLDDALGFPLFDRTGRSATLNAAGQTTVERAEVICALFSKLGDPRMKAPRSGFCALAPLPRRSRRSWRALEGLRRPFPLVRVHVSPGVSMRLVDDLDAGKIDAAVMIHPPSACPPTWRGKRWSTSPSC